MSITEDPSVLSQATDSDEARRTVAALQAVLAATHYPLVLDDDFSRNEHGWDTGESDDELSTGKQEITRGAYRWEVQALDSFAWWSLPDMDKVSDFYLTVELRQVAGSAESEYGVIFRAQEDDHYAFCLRGDGCFTAYRDYQNEVKTLIEWRATPAFVPGEATWLTVAARGPHVVLLINDRYVGEFDDDALACGKVGLLIGLKPSEEKAIFEFIRLELRAP